MSKNNKVRILWLTDIHFSAAYREITDPRFRGFIDDFYNKIRLEQADQPFQYILITGDLAQTGSNEDYDAFWDLFLKRLLDIFLENKDWPVPKVLTIPGNHDVQWGNGDFLSEYVKKFNHQLRTKG